MTLSGSFLAIDFETCSHNRACALGFAHVVDGTVVETEATLIKPLLHDSDWRFTEIHGIAPDDVRDAPSFAEVWNSVDARFSGELLVAHNASFDIGVLQSELRRAGIGTRAPLNYRCSAALARLAWPAIERVTLAHLTTVLRIDLDHHEAGSDARACALVTLAAAKALHVSAAADLPDAWRMAPARAA